MCGSASASGMQEIRRRCHTELRVVRARMHSVEVNFETAGTKMVGAEPMPILILCKRQLGSSAGYSRFGTDVQNKAYLKGRLLINENTHSRRRPGWLISGISPVSREEANEVTVGRHARRKSCENCRTDWTSAPWLGNAAYPRCAGARRRKDDADIIVALTDS